MKIILLVEDDAAVQRVVESVLQGKALCLTAATLAEASLFFVKYWDCVDAILMDRSVPTGGPGKMSPEEWIRKVRGMRFGKDIIAFSTDPGSRESLMAAGCNKQFAKEGESFDRLLALLDIPVDTPSVH